MMRNFFLFLSKQKGIRRWMETSSFSQKITKRYIAGATLDEALAVVTSLAEQGVQTTLDHLGESVTSIEEAGRSRDAYIEALDRIAQRGLPATVSIKLTQFGLDVSEDRCLENVRMLVAKAEATGNRVEIDMESSGYADRTLAIATTVAPEHPYSVRSVVQAYLFRTAADIDMLNRKPIPVRLVKGAYNEPPEVAFAKKTEVDRNYVALMRKLLEEGVYPAIATHDEKIVEEAFGYPPEKFEFQMLYGIRRDLQRRIVDKGYRLRLYVPYGTEWYPYVMRRLAERPANAWFVARNLFR